ncbi:MAG: multicopper oxidase domain-containing protein [Xanthobacteraceae bacterium]|nr:multicopper oxidase domain-containing protein [Xanthobacteraceae bacterium]
MTTQSLSAASLHRRAVLAGLAGGLLAVSRGSAQPAATPIPLTLRARPVRRALRPGGPDAEIWTLEPDAGGPLAFRRGDRLVVTFRNELPVPAVLNWRGLDGVPEAEPLLARPPLAPGAQDTFALPLRQAGTLLCDARLLGDGGMRASGALALAVGGDGGAADRDLTFLIEDWRLRADGGAIAPGAAASDAPVIHTVNGHLPEDIAARPNEQLRFCFINGCQRSIIALKIENYNVRVLAIDGRPAEPFQARDGQLVLAPGTRIDAVIDATGGPGSAAQILLRDDTGTRPIGRLTISGDPVRAAPLPPPAALASEGLPERIELRNALRLDLALDRDGGSPGGWIAPARFDPTAAPAFRVRRDRAVVLALTNRAPVPVTFHLHGHPMRLLDRLDDGWKPFWLDTLAIGPGQTQRVAFKAETTGRWLMQSLAADWAAPRLIHHYVVE